MKLEKNSEIFKSISYLFLIVIYYLTGGNNSMSRFCKFGKLHVTKGNALTVYCGLPDESKPS